MGVKIFLFNLNVKRKVVFKSKLSRVRRESQEQSCPEVELSKLRREGVRRRLICLIYIDLEL